MATLIPNRSRVVWQEDDVTPPAGLRPNDAYDLALFHEMGRPGRGVLIVKSVLQLQFKDGTSVRPETKGQTLRWAEAEKRSFASDFRAAVLDVWNDKFRITTASTVPAVTDIGVQFEVETVIDGWTLADHWELAVEKVDQFSQSWVNDWTGNCSLDSGDLTPVTKSAGRTQRGAVHEFGHMLGLRDEYNGANSGNTNWQTDLDSIMHSGEVVRDRHYAMFADWITGKFGHVAHLAGERIDFKVSGRVDLSAARL